MILGVPARPGLRIMVASKPVDFRNYAECLVMRSARLGASIAAVYPATPLRITTILFDACRIKEDAHAEFYDDPHGPDLVS